MGACYSRKAGVGKYTYSTVQMASTKLDDSSRLARPTPYTRNSLSSPSVFSSKKGIPVPAKHGSPRLDRHANNTSDSKLNKESPQQSSIPRFNSNTSSTPVKAELNENIVNANITKNENNQLHFVNNNTVSSSPLTSDSKGKPAPTSLKQTSHKLNISSKNLPDKTKADDKNQSRIPSKMNCLLTGLPRSQLPQCTAKSPHVLSHLNADAHSDSKRFTHSSEKLCIQENVSPNNSKNFPGGLETRKISNATSESRESIIDFDSGIGSSFIEKTKPDDSDTLIDIERLESCEVSPTSISDREQLVSSDSKKSNEKQSLKYPIYKRGVNGKWTVDDANFGAEKHHVSCAEKQTISPNNENVFKMNMPDSSFSTYASYKGLLSNKKYTNHKQRESTGTSAKSPACKTIETNASITKETRSYMKNNVNDNSKQKNENYSNVGKIQSPNSPISKQPSVDSDDKSDELGSDTKSPMSEIENREFLIDDEISDQPELVCSFINGNMSESPVPSLQQSVTELLALQISNTSKKTVEASNSKSRRDRIGSDHRDSVVLLSSELGSSCSSIASDDLMMDFEKKMDFPDGTINEGMASPMRKSSDLQAVEDQLSALAFSNIHKTDVEERTRKRLYRRSSGPFVTSGALDERRLRSVSLPLRPPRPMSVSGADDGSIILDSSSYRLVSQDLNGVKTLLLRLKSVIQEAETINPFEQNIFFQSLVHSDFPLSSSFLNESGAENNPSSKSAGLSLENADLRRQNVLLQQQLEEKDRTILLLQQQMTKYANIPRRYDHETCQSSNAATQTERSRSLASSLSPSLNNSSETLVSSARDTSEEHVVDS